MTEPDNRSVLRLERGRIVLELPTVELDLMVNGALQAEYFRGVSEGPEDFRERLRRANAAHAAVSMMAQVRAGLEKPRQPGTGKSESARRAAFAEGLLIGVRGEYRTVQGMAMAPQTAENVEPTNYADGWHLGFSIYRAIEIARTGADPISEAVQ